MKILNRLGYASLFILCLSLSSASAQDNLLLNGSFEGYTSHPYINWAGNLVFTETLNNWDNRYYSSYKTSTPYSTRGLGARVDIAGGGVAQTVHSVFPEVDYIFSGKLRCNADYLAVTITCDFYDADGTRLSTHTKSITSIPQNTWITVADTFTTPQNTDHFHFDFETRPQEYDNPSINIDEFVLQRVVEEDTVDPTVTLTSAPAEGAIYRVGQTFNLTWESSDNTYIAEQRVEYCVNGPPYTTLRTWASSSQAAWAVPMPDIEEPFVFLRVVAVDQAGNTGEAHSAPFQIIRDPKPTVDLLHQPYEGQELPTGGFFNLRWYVESQGVGLASTFFEYRVGSSEWRPMKQFEGDTQQYEFALPTVAVDSLQFRIIATDNSGASDSLDSHTFSIISPSGVDIPDPWAENATSEEAEPNMDALHACPIAAGETIQGQLAHGEDVDMFRIDLEGGQPLTFTLSCWPSLEAVVEFSSTGNFEDTEDGSFAMMPDVPMETPGFELYDYPHPTLNMQIDALYPRYASRSLFSETSQTVYARIVTEQVDENAPWLPYGLRDYRVKLTASHTTDAAQTDGSFDILIWDADPSEGSGEALAEAFGSYGFTSLVAMDYQTVLDRKDEARAICFCLGTSPNNAHINDYPVIRDLPPEALYIEGGDLVQSGGWLANNHVGAVINGSVDDIGLIRPAWVFDPAEAQQGQGDILRPVGVYVGENQRIDGFLTDDEAAVPLLSVNNYTVMAYNHYLHWVISSLEFSGLRDISGAGDGRHTQAVIAGKILEGLGLRQSVGGGPTLESVVLDGPHLGATWPNPFNETASVRVLLPGDDHLRLDLYNILGRRVATFFDGRAQAGQQVFTLNGGHLASGTYFLRMTTGSGDVDLRRISLVR